MSGRWIRDCERILNQMKEFRDIKGQDRLDMVRTIRFVLHGLHRSVSGWIIWINNPDIMSSFSLAELKEIGENIAKLTQSFIEYDCKITTRAEKDLTIRQPETPIKSTKKQKDRTEVFYVK